ncbi:hypothetical protein FHL15_008018 [Xylaria flabelliformis]|uniref:Uncharacterized protein n=1 Tax=Xylaria flabelliformis TaxID=2512241 RepID=A0A553HSV2_9PEZI|nr:hypothetical protein FHL15_008018 [Xylaria flabelliformis]
MNRGQISEAAAPRSPVSEIYNTADGTTDTSRLSHPHGIQVDAASPDRNRPVSTDSIETLDWLMEATVDLSRDLDTSKKELEIIKFILDEMELRSRTDRRPGVTKGEIELMRACREYSSSRCHMLRERLRQTQFWTRSRAIGQQVPGRMPEEWRFVDIEWRRWLSDQASSHGDQLGGNRESSNNTIWDIWGPLPHILSADIWWKEMRSGGY